ncbi:MAG: xanthine dehydrogenase family protein subunit M [Alphaproteobacteria bacterium]|nr:xanthine dehydrogenase family protein subunit M [Alphaproteobacteria bacterium]
MKPARFLYAAPETVDEVLDLLNAHGDEAKLLAGGQSLMPLMNMRLARPAVVIDLNRVRALDGVDEADGALRFGAMVRQRTAEKHALVRGALPMLPQALAWVGHTQVRTRGTIGGSLVHADPAAELPAVAALHEATFVLRKKSSERVLAAADFFITYLTTAIAPTELLTEIRIPALPAGTGTSVLEVSRRHGDFAMAGAAGGVKLDGDGRCADARLAFFGVGPTPVRIDDAEALLRGRSLDDATLRELARLVSARVEPDSDIHADADYRRHLAGVLAKRVVAAAANHGTEAAA